MWMFGASSNMQPRWKAEILWGMQQGSALGDSRRHSILPASSCWACILARIFGESLVTERKEVKHLGDQPWIAVRHTWGWSQSVKGSNGVERF